MKIGFRLRKWARTSLGLAVVLTVLLAPARVLASSRWETLEAIHRVENPRNTSAPGRHGELGAYQFRPSTWRMHTRRPFAHALDRAASEDVALRHYEWLRRGLLRNGMQDTPYNIALAWNGGLSAAVRGQSSSSAHEYAERVTNLVADLRGSRLAASP